MRLGVDLSVMDELEKLNPVYKYQGKEIEPFHFFATHSGISVVRIRLWNRPYDDNGNPYGGGTNDLDCFIRLAKRAQKEGMQVMLDFHYSDFWADPSRQLLPKDWKDLKTLDEVANALYEFTRNSLIEIKENGIDLIGIQIGNEISPGMCWPFGNRFNEYNPVTGGGFEGLSALLRAGSKACHEVFPSAKRIIHLEHSGSYDMQDEYLSSIIKNGVEFEVIGESYYPYWHGSFSMFKDCMSRIKVKYQKEIWVVELGYEYMQWTDNPDYSEVKDAKENDFVVGNVNGRVPFPKTKEGQNDYIALILKICKEIGIEMVCYWEPTWIHIDGNGWATHAGQIYCGQEPGPAGNVWEIETLFDLEGNAVPAIDVFTQKFIDEIK